MVNHASEKLTKEEIEELENMFGGDIRVGDRIEEDDFTKDLGAALLSSAGGS